jgi:hypothetical protein
MLSDFIYFSMMIARQPLFIHLFEEKAKNLQYTHKIYSDLLFLLLVLIAAFTIF